jgi:hypothetical protein
VARGHSGYLPSPVTFTPAPSHQELLNYSLSLNRGESLGRHTPAPSSSSSSGSSSSSSTAVVEAAAAVAVVVVVVVVVVFLVKFNVCHVLSTE